MPIWNSRIQLYGAEYQTFSGAELLLQNRVQYGIITLPKRILWNSLIWTNCNRQNVSEQQASAEIYIASGEPCCVGVKFVNKPGYLHNAEGGTNPSGYFMVQCFKIVCVFSMRGDFSLLFVKGYVWQTRLYSWKAEVSRRQPLPVSVWQAKAASNSSCLDKTIINGSIVWYFSAHGKLFTALMTISLNPHV